MTGLKNRFSCVALIASMVLATTVSMPAKSFAQGGCGAFCLPQELFNQGGSASDFSRFRFLLNNEYVDLDGYYEGSDPIANPSQAAAIINITTFDVNVALTERWSVDALVPWIRKTQNNRRFGQRRADGVGDIAIINNISLVAPLSADRISVRVGLKFATGDIEEPSATNKLPNPFQTGSGAEDFLVGLNYFRSLGRVRVYGNWMSRLPLTENKFYYTFGNEHRIQGGDEIPLAQTTRAGFEALLGIATNFMGHDQTQSGDVPARLLDGETVLNTGGNWVDFTPGLRVNLARGWFAQGRVHIPMYEDWHGERSRGVGQVRPGSRLQLTVGLDLRPSQR